MLRRRSPRISTAIRSPQTPTQGYYATQQDNNISLSRSNLPETQVPTPSQQSPLSSLQLSDDNFSENALWRSSRPRSQTNFYSPSPTPRNSSSRVEQVPLTNDVDIASIATRADPPDPTQQDLSSIWVAFTDGSYTATSKLCGWGAVIVTNGGLSGVRENEGEIVKQLGGKVCLNKSKNWLRNVGRVTSNNTAELTGVGEAILYFLQELRKTTPPLLTKLVIRTDSEYAENAIKGINRPQEKIFK